MKYCDITSIKIYLFKFTYNLLFDSEEFAHSCSVCPYFHTFETVNYIQNVLRFKQVSRILYFI